MTTRAQPQPGALCWVGVICPGDGEPEKTFYTALFGWDYADIADPGDPPFYVATLGGDRVACLSGSGSDQPGAWVTAVSVSDRDEAAHAVNRAGGSAAPGDTTEIPTVGRFSRVLDPAGAEIHLVEVDGVVAQRVGEPGAWSTSSLVSDDPSSVAAFYRDVLDWRLDLHGGSRAEGVSAVAGEEFPEAATSTAWFRLPGYSSHLADRSDQDDVVATIEATIGRSPEWLPIFRVVDIDLAMQAAVRHSGQVLLDRTTDRGVRKVVLSDPGGARFAVVQLEPRLRAMTFRGPAGRT